MMKVLLGILGPAAMLLLMAQGLLIVRQGPSAEQGLVAVTEDSVTEASVTEHLLVSQLTRPQTQPQSISATRVNVPTAGSSGSSGNFRDSRPQFGASSASAARQYNATQTYRAPPPLVTSQQVSRGVVQRNVLGNRWGW